MISHFFLLKKSILRSITRFVKFYQFFIHLESLVNQYLYTSVYILGSFYSKQAVWMQKCPPNILRAAKALKCNPFIIYYCKRLNLIVDISLKRLFDQIIFLKSGENGHIIRNGLLQYLHAISYKMLNKNIKLSAAKAVKIC